MPIKQVLLAFVMLASPSLSLAQAVSVSEKAKIQQYIDDYYKGLEVVAVIAAANGKSLDCFRVDRQPALRAIDPKTGQVTFAPLAVKPEPVSASRAEFPPLCAVGTVPVESLLYEDIAEFGTLEAYVNRVIPAFTGPIGGKSGPTTNLTTVGDAYALAQTSWATTGSISGGAVDQLWLYNPAIQTSSYTSAAAVSLHKLAGPNAAYNAVMAGWQISPSRTGQSVPVLFVNATRAGWTEANCFTSCGWIQVSPDIKPNFTSFGGLYIRVRIEWNGFAWALYVQDFLVGYWQASSFDSTFNAGFAEAMDYGGYVGGPTGIVTSPHTTTDMGNGGYGASSTSAAEARDARVRVGSFPSWIYTGLGVQYLSNQSNCWNSGAPDAAPPPYTNHMRYGGPGKLFPLCI